MVKQAICILIVPLAIAKTKRIKTEFQGRIVDGTLSRAVDAESCPYSAAINASYSSQHLFSTGMWAGCSHLRGWLVNRYINHSLSNRTGLLAASISHSFFRSPSVVSNCFAHRFFTSSMFCDLGSIEEILLTRSNMIQINNRGGGHDSLINQ